MLICTYFEYLLNIRHYFYSLKVSESCLKIIHFTCVCLCWLLHSIRVCNYACSYNTAFDIHTYFSKNLFVDIISFFLIAHIHGILNHLLIHFCFHLFFLEIFAHTCNFLNVHISINLGHNFIGSLHRVHHR